MAKGILSEYGPDRAPDKRAKCGGDMTGYVKPLRYSEPVGPKGQMHKGVGLGGTNHGSAGTQGKR
jgi:hypothetical protein